MATVVRVPGDKRASGIGEALGAILGAKQEAKRQDAIYLQEEEDAKLSSELQRVIASSPNRNAAMQAIGNSRYSRILAEIPDMKAAVGIVDKIHPIQNDKLESVTIQVPVDAADPAAGQFTREILVPRSKLKGGLTSNEQLAEIAGVPKGAVLADTTPRGASGKEPHFRLDKDGKVIGTAGFHVPGKGPEGSVPRSVLTEQRAQADSDAKVLKAQADGDSGVSETDAGLRAAGALRKRGIPVNATTQSKMMASQVSAQNQAKRLASAFGGKLEDAKTGIMSYSFQGGDGLGAERFGVGQQVLIDLLYNTDIDPGRAFNSAKRAAYAMYPRIDDLTKKLKDQPATRLTLNTLRGKLQLGKVYDHPEVGLVLYMGEKVGVGGKSIPDFVPLGDL